MNLGNTCYLAAAVQLLAHTRSFARLLVSTSARSAGGPAGALHAGLARLLVELWAARPEGTAASPQALLCSLAHLTARGGGFSDLRAQNDSHELLVLMLEALERERPDLCDPFRGELEHEVRCGACSHASRTAEPFVTLPLAIAGASAAECLEAHLAPEALPGWRCEACKAAGSGVRESRIKRAPQSLLLGLKRFGDGGRVLRTPVLPDELLAVGGRRLRLAAAVCHYGTQGGGHYVACCRRPGGDWWLLDDARPSPLAAQGGGLPGDAVYLLAYDAMDA